MVPSELYQVLLRLPQELPWLTVAKYFDRIESTQTRALQFLPKSIEEGGAVLRKLGALRAHVSDRNVLGALHDGRLPRRPVHLRTTFLPVFPGADRVNLRFGAPETSMSVRGSRARIACEDRHGGPVGARIMEEGFWNAVFTARDAGAMAEKHAWLRRAVLEADGPISSSALQEAARRWPGSLRECQRVAPERYRAREQWALYGAATHDRARAAWLAEGHAAVCLWSELHHLIADVLAFRAVTVGRVDPAELLRDLTLRDPE